MPEYLVWDTIHDPHDAPSTTGVYAYLQEGHYLYIGKAVSLRSRLLSHAQNARLDARESAYVNGADAIRYTICDTEFKALLLEASLIQQYLPDYNRALRDDKSYLYIVINTKDEFPKPRLARARELFPNRVRNSALPNPVRNKHIFGPFPSSRVAEEVLKTIRRLIPFCQQKEVGRRRCFYSHLGLCDPCPSTIHTPEEKRRYRHQIFQVIHILQGKIEPVVTALRAEMAAASESQHYEKALDLRKKISRFERYIQTHSYSETHLTYNNADTELAALEKLLRLPRLHRIEGYDASNFLFEHSVVSLVVMTDGLIDKSQYRRFKMKNPRVRSDFDRLEEAIIRRLKNPRWPSPDLVVIDGGTPQLRRLQRTFDQLPTAPAYLGLAKHPDRIIFPSKSEGFVTLRPKADDPALHLLERLRDEAHRFANQYRKLLLKKSQGI